MAAVTWDQLRIIPRDTLAAGDRIVGLDVGVAFWFRRDGRVRGVETWSGEGPVPVRGDVWTVVAVHGGGRFAGRREDGVEKVGCLPKTVMRVEAPAVPTETEEDGA